MSERNARGRLEGHTSPPRDACPPIDVWHRVTKLSYSFTFVSFCSFIAVLNKRRIICKINLLSFIFIWTNRNFPCTKNFAVGSRRRSAKSLGPVVRKRINSILDWRKLLFHVNFLVKVPFAYFCFSRLTTSTVKFFPNISVKQHLRVEK